MGVPGTESTGGCLFLSAWATCTTVPLLPIADKVTSVDRRPADLSSAIVAAPIRLFQYKVDT